MSSLYQDQGTVKHRNIILKCHVRSKSNFIWIINQSDLRTGSLHNVGSFSLNAFVTIKDALR